MSDWTDAHRHILAYLSWLGEVRADDLLRHADVTRVQIGKLVRASAIDVEGERPFERYMLTRIGRELTNELRARPPNERARRTWCLAMLVWFDRSLAAHGHDYGVPREWAFLGRAELTESIVRAETKQERWPWSLTQPMLVGLRKAETWWKPWIGPSYPPPVQEAIHTMMHNVLTGRAYDQTSAEGRSVYLGRTRTYADWADEARAALTAAGYDLPAPKGKP